MRLYPLSPMVMTADGPRWRRFPILLVGLNREPPPFPWRPGPIAVWVGRDARYWAWGPLPELLALALWYRWRRWQVERFLHRRGWMIGPHEAPYFDDLRFVPFEVAVQSRTTRLEWQQLTYRKVDLTMRLAMLRARSII